MYAVGIAVPRRLVGEVAQRLVLLDGPGDLLVHVRRDQLRAPVAVVGRKQPGDGDVVQQARHDHLLVEPVLPGHPGALQQVRARDRVEPEQVEVPQRRPFRHRGQRRVVAHHEQRVGVLRLGQQRALVAAGRGAQDRRGRRHDDAPPPVDRVVQRLADPVVQARLPQRGGQLVRKHPGRWLLSHKATLSQRVRLAMAAVRGGAHAAQDHAARPAAGMGRRGEGLLRRRGPGVHLPARQRGLRHPLRPAGRRRRGQDRRVRDVRGRAATAPT